MRKIMLDGTDAAFLKGYKNYYSNIRDEMSGLAVAVDRENVRMERNKKRKTFSMLGHAISKDNLKKLTKKERPPYAMRTLTFVYDDKTLEDARQAIKASEEYLSYAYSLINSPGIISQASEDVREWLDNGQ